MPGRDELIVKKPIAELGIIPVEVNELVHEMGVSPFRV